MSYPSDINAVQPGSHDVDEVSLANGLGALLGYMKNGPSVVDPGGTGMSVVDPGGNTGADPLKANATTPTPSSEPSTASSSTTPAASNTNPLPGAKYNIEPQGQYGAKRAGESHPGIDLVVAPGTTAVSAINGTVSAASGGQGGYGNLIEITGSNGVKIRYGHMSSIGVKVGQQVSAGTPIGKTGGAAGAAGSGNSTGPHLHFEVDLPGGGTTDPTPYLAGGTQILSGTAAPDLNATPTTSPENAVSTGLARALSVSAGQGDPGSTNQAAPTVPSNATAAGKEAPTGNADAILRQAMRIAGVPDDWYPSLHKIMMRESGGRNIPQGITDINTAKGTPAFGPMQIIQPTFNAHALPGYTDWHNPLDSTIAAIRYIQARYGRPDNGPDGPGGY